MESNKARIEMLGGHEEAMGIWRGERGRREGPPDPHQHILHFMVGPGDTTAPLATRICLTLKSRFPFSARALRNRLSAPLFSASRSSVRTVLVFRTTASRMLTSLLSPPGVAG